MEAEYLAINECRQRQVIKQVRKEFPHIRVAVLSQALIVEAIDLGDLSGFVIAAQDRNSFPVSNLKGRQI